MKKNILLIWFVFLTIACSSKKEGNMIVEGTIKGLKKGTLYLQKVKDTILVSIDSVDVFADGNYRLSDNVTSSVIYYLTFKGNTTNRRILFFGNKGTININDNDKIELFGVNPKITGSKNQLVFNNFTKINSKFKDQRLDFIKKEFDARKAKNKTLLTKLNKDFKNMIRRKYLYATNFALTNSTSEVAPYIAITELYNANIKLLDTINNSLSAKVKNSDYGIRLNEFIKKLKVSE